MRMVTFRLKVVHNLSVWALRACSYKTKAEHLLSPQKLFDLFLPKSESAKSVLSVVEQKLSEDRKVYPCLSPCDGCKTLEG